MSFSGNLRKMRVEDASPVRYFMRFNELEVEMNPLIGRPVTLAFSGRIQCIACGRVSKKSFNQGYCFPCFRSLARCDRCIVSPELCHFHLGTCREPDWGQANCMQPHVIYLANSSGVKVGITRRSQLPTRWIDQGAVEAVPLLQVSSRRASGMVETALKSQFADRTDWRRMLKGPPEPADLAARSKGLRALCERALEDAEEEPGTVPAGTLDFEPRRFEYPVIEYPSKVRSINVEKQPEIQGRLLGIKGQYLIFDCGVINVRKHAGYEAMMS